MWRLVKNDGVEVLRQAYSLEHEADKQKINVESGDKCRTVRLSLIKHYEDIYKQYIRGLEMLNYARHVARDEHMDGPESDNAREIATFCEEQMNTYMDRGVNVLHKIESILIPIEYVDNMMKSGYVSGNTVYFRDGNKEPLTMSKNVIDETRTLQRGTYRLLVKYHDNYSLAAPTIKIGLEVKSENDPGSFVVNSRGAVLCQYAWRRDFGVWNSASVHFTVHASGMRDAHVSITLQEWIPNDPLTYVGPRPPTPPAPLTFPESHSSLNSLLLFTEANDAQHNLQQSYTQSTNYIPEDSYYNDTDSNAMIANPTTVIHAPGPNSVVPLDDAYLAALAAYTSNSNESDANNNKVLSNRCDLFDVMETQPPTRISVSHGADSQTIANNNNNINNNYNNNTNSNNVVIVNNASVEINPPNMTCAQREERLRQILNSWPHDGVTAVPLPNSTNRALQVLHSLPFPSEINGDDDDDE